MKLESASVKNNAASKPIDRVEKLEKETANLNMAVRILQMLLKQVMEQQETNKSDLRTNTSMLNDFQYRLLGLQAATNVNVSDVAKITDELKLKDWNEASAKKDAEGNFGITNTVASADDVVILTSTTPDLKEDAGIFRSRTALSETANKDLIEALMNKTVGDKVEVYLNGTRHVIELLGVRVKPTETKTETAVSQ